MGVPELVEDGVGGLLVDPGESDQLADALRTLAADPELRRRMGEAGRRKVEAEFDAATEAAKLSAVLATYVCARPSAARAKPAAFAACQTPSSASRPASRSAIARRAAIPKTPDVSEGSRRRSPVRAARVRRCR